MDGMSGRVLVLVLAAAVVPVWSLDLPDVENVTDPVFEEKLKQVRSKYTHPLIFPLFTYFKLICIFLCRKEKSVTTLCQCVQSGVH